MEPTISNGSWLIARPTAPEDIGVGAIVAIPGASKGMPGIVHRVVGLLEDGERTFAITMGDNNPVSDPDLLVLDEPVGRIILIVPYLGWLITPAIAWQLATILLLYWALKVNFLDSNQCNRVKQRA